MIVTFEEAVKIYDELRPLDRASKSSLRDFEEALVKHMSMENHDHSAIVVECPKIYRRIQRYYITRARDRCKKFDLTEVCFSTLSPSTEAEPSPSPDFDSPSAKRSRTKHPLEHVTCRARYYRLKDMIEDVKTLAQEQSTSPAYLLGTALKQIYYHDDRTIADMADNLMNYAMNMGMTAEPKGKVSVETAANVKNNNNLGREMYQREVRALGTVGMEVLPTWKNLRAFEKEITPEVDELPDGGVQFEYKKALQMTAERILENVSPDLDLPAETVNLTLDVKDGLDGSGSHKIFNQDG